MRVLHWYPNYLGGGGVANAVLGLSAGQSRLGAAVGIAAAQLSGPALYEPMRGANGVSLLEWQPRWVLRSGQIRLRHVPGAALRRLRAFNPDIVHVHGEFNPDNLWVPYVFRCPVILSPHGGFRPAARTGIRRTLKRLYFLTARALLYRRVAAVHAVSPVERAHIMHVLPDQRVFCIPQGPNIRAYASEAPGRQTAPEGGVQFVFVGRLDVFTKGLDILLEAFAAAGGLVGRQVTLTLVGPDWRGGRAWLQKRGRELGIASKVLFAGALSGHEVASVLSCADVYVQLSRYDSFSLSVSEALLGGKPSILSEGIGVASYPEVAALPHVRVIPPRVVDATNAMVEFVARLDELRTAARHNEPRVADFFSWERIARSQLEMYGAVIAEQGGGAANLSAQHSKAGRPRSDGLTDSDHVPGRCQAVSNVSCSTIMGRPPTGERRSVR